MKIILVIFIGIVSANTQAGLFKKNSSPEWPWDTSGKVCEAASCTPQEDLNNLNKANKFCRAVYNHYENNLNRQNRTPYLVGILGSLAGIFSPISSGDMAKGLAGFSGAANALQVTTTKAVQNSVSINTLKFIDQLVLAGNNEFVSRTTDKTIVAMNMASRCAYAASNVEAAILEGTQQAIKDLDNQEKMLVPQKTNENQSDKK